MAKGKTPTPQELYRARKQREEAERDALLPPGLVNNGNTCFMNSVMQGLIATRTLEAFAHFQPLPPAVQFTTPDITPRRSPLMTNGHGFGGEYEKEWEEGMPLGDVFLRIMEKAWDMEKQKTRQSFSPKELLTALGKKYDQYLDFRQQDAHEYYCHLMDAIRMEEVDIIKKRQPPPPKKKKRPKQNNSSHSDASTSAAQTAERQEPTDDPNTPSVSIPLLPEDIPVSERLTPFVDMLFTGQLASILVCEKCKHVSHTYEDFIDLSLPIKPEDLANERARKRDRLKTFAQRLRKKSTRNSSSPIPPGSNAGFNAALGISTGGPPILPRLPPGLGVRSTSVPPSPTRRSSDLTGREETELPVNEDVRRRSLDGVPEGSSLRNLVAGGETPPQPDDDAAVVSPEDAIVAPVLLASPVPPIPILELDEAEAELVVTTEKKDLPPLPPIPSPPQTMSKRDGAEGWGRLGRRISVRMSKVMEGMDGRGRARAAKGEGSDGHKRLSAASPVARPISPNSRPNSLPITEQPAPSKTPDRDAPAVLPQSMKPSATSVSTAMSPVRQSTTERPHFSREASSSSMASLSLPPPVVAPAVLSATSHSFPFPHGGKEKEKQWKPPKPTPEEAAYLRRILADAAPPGPHNGFNLFSKHTPATTPPVLTPGPTFPFSVGLWNKLGPASGIEDCLRMFTAVEALDGENMVGCRRCWKLAHGTYRTRVRSRPPSEKGSDSDTESISGADERKDLADSKQNSHVRMPASSSPNHSGVNTPVSSANSDGPSFSFEDLGETASIPTTVQSEPNGQPYLGQIPSISTTEPPESPGPVPPPKSPVPEPSKATLRAPKPRFRQRPKILAKDDFETEFESSSTSDSDTSSSDEEAASDATDVSSAAISPSGSPKMTNGAPLAKIPKSKRVIMQRAYKRYLIATPPPVLVVHLKRFQQVSKVPAVSFSSGFKKVDDYVSFPEYFDLTPFLAPKKEEFRSGKSEVLKTKMEEDKKSVYRLYAVIVHIGNMLGGHYVAYTALSSSSTQAPASLTDDTNTSTDAAVGSTTAGHTLSLPIDPAEARPIRQWAYISDSVVRLTTLEEVLKAKAYICMYEKL